MEVLENFGVQPVLLLAQIVNFIILLFLLKKFAYKPIMKVLEERRIKIETGVRQAEEAEKKLMETEVRQKEIISGAEQESSRIIQETKHAVKKLQDETLVETNKKAEEMMDRNKEVLQLEKEKMISEVKIGMAELVAETTKKVVGKTLSQQENERLVRESLKNI
ncbi:F0F1 ATP synthase subunit B [Patescibacteria group bacterium]|nr:F0F1 ATP synthase subunit B [Patescibacteria group bacterium]